MMTFNNFLVAMAMFMAFGLTSNSVNSYNVDCPVKFPEGFFCNVICEKWGILNGNTIMCFLSHQGGYERFVARNPAYGVWRFYKVDIASDVEPLCQRAVVGDEFYLNETEVMCSTPQPHKKRYYYSNMNSMYRSEVPTYEYDDMKPAVRSDLDTSLPMDAICELATSQICRERKIMNCRDDDKCCYTEIPPSACHEKNMSKFSDCYKVLYNAINSTLLY